MIGLPWYGVYEVGTQDLYYIDHIGILISIY